MRAVGSGRVHMNTSSVPAADNWRQEWLESSPGLCAILKPTMEDANSPMPGEAAAVAEALKNSKYEKRVTDVQVARSLRDRECQQALARRTAPSAWETDAPATSSCATPRLIETPRSSRSASSRVASAPHGREVALTWQSFGSNCESSRATSVRAARTNFAYMASSPTYCHSGGPICWFGKASRRRRVRPPSCAAATVGGLTGRSGEADTELQASLAAATAAKRSVDLFSTMDGEEGPPPMPFAYVTPAGKPSGNRSERSG